MDRQRDRLLDWKKGLTDCEWETDRQIEGETAKQKDKPVKRYG